MQITSVHTRTPWRQNILDSILETLVHIEYGGIHSKSNNYNVLLRSINTPLDVFHDKGNPALRGIRFSTRAGLNQGGLVGGGVELGQVFLSWDGQRDVLEVFQSNRHLEHKYNHVTCGADLRRQPVGTSELITSSSTLFSLCHICRTLNKETQWADPI